MTAAKPRVRRSRRADAGEPGRHDVWLPGRRNSSAFARPVTKSIRRPPGLRGRSLLSVIRSSGCQCAGQAPSLAKWSGESDECDPGCSGADRGDGDGRAGVANGC